MAIRLQLAVIALAMIVAGFLFATPGTDHSTYTCASIASQLVVGGDRDAHHFEDGLYDLQSLNDVRPSAAPQDVAYLYAETIYREQQMEAMDARLLAKCDAERHSRGTVILMVASMAIAALIVIDGVFRRSTAREAS